MGFDISGIVLCWAVVEFCLNNVLLKDKIYLRKLGQIVIERDGGEYCLYEKINIAFNLDIIDEDLKDKAHEIRSIANGILHDPDDPKKIDSNNSKKMIQHSFSIIEQCYN